MPVSEKQWREVIGDFIPVGMPRPQDLRRIFVDRYENDPTESILVQLRAGLLSRLEQPKPYQALLTGCRGSGKSSELMRLAQEVADEFFVVWFDAETTLNDYSVNQFDVLLGIGLAAHKAAHQAGLRPPQKLAENLSKSLAKVVRKYEDRVGFTLNLNQLLKQVTALFIGAGAGAAAGPAGSALGAATGVMLASTKLELNVRDEFVRNLELPANRSAVIGALNEIIGWAGKRSLKPVLIIVDGLDRVSAARARLLFAESSLLSEPACALIYAAPIEFYFRIGARGANDYFTDYKILPNLPVVKRPPTGDDWRAERQDDEAAIEVMRKVVRKRLENRGLQQRAVVTDEALDVMAKMSGGVMRDLIRLFSDATTFAQALKRERIDEEVARKSVYKHRREMSGRMTVVHRNALIDVLKEGCLKDGNQTEVEDDLVKALYLLSYQSGDDAWFDAHPNLLPVL